MAQQLSFKNIIDRGNKVNKGREKVCASLSQKAGELPGEGTM